MAHHQENSSPSRTQHHRWNDQWDWANRWYDLHTQHETGEERSIYRSTSGSQDAHMITATDHINIWMYKARLDDPMDGQLKHLDRLQLFRRSSATTPQMDETFITYQLMCSATTNPLTRNSNWTRLHQKEGWIREDIDPGAGGGRTNTSDAEE